MRQVPGAVDVDLSTKGQKPELDVQVDRGLAGSLGITVGQVAQALRPAFAGIDVGDWVDPSGETRDVTIRLAPESRTVVADLESLPLVVPGPDGPKTIPLGQVARITPGLGPARIDHLDRDRVINVEANTEGAALSEVVNAAMARIEQNVKFPAGYGLSQGGQTEGPAGDLHADAARDRRRGDADVLRAGGAVRVVPRTVLDPAVAAAVAHRRDARRSTSPKTPLNIMSMIGVVLLVGIVAKNAILLIDFAKWSEEAGMERREALILAGRVRLRPILMTTFALVAGMIPVALGSGEGGDFRAPLGISVIGGVITSTLLTLLVIPTVYESLADTRDWIIARFQGEKRHHKQAHEPGAPLVAPTVHA